MNGPAMRWVYVNIAATRIQSYLSRTPDLKGVRGASAWLGDTSCRDSSAAWVAAASGTGDGDVEINAEAGQADGVFPLRFPSCGDATADHRRAAATANAAQTAIRRQLPAVPLAAGWATGSSYVEAYPDGLAAEDALPVSPPVDEIPFLQSCATCRADPAVTDIDLHERQVRVCADCAARYTDRYRQPGLRQATVPVSAETRLLHALDVDETHTARHFDALAALGAADGNRNHVASVYIDGNNLGRLFEAAATSGDTELKARLSEKVSAATRGALIDATRTVWPRPDDRGDQTAVPVIPHLVGGDDVLVSVVADRAWLFTTAYLHSFRGRMQKVTDLPAAATTSASAAIVFAHSKHPFRRSVDLAAELLTRAKREHCGRQPAIAWLDVTRDGDQPVPERRSWTLEHAATLDPAMRALSALPAAARAEWGRLCDPDRPQISAARLRRHGRRLERSDVVEPLLEHGGPAAVAAALSLARWWS
ncbi:Cas10/Cmr2 second palm domain-containing protein [Mangrovihabitans endophyticus]|uniref:Cas10/Cmr2 second palm domain-containing protein n=1 Tax=Mangrovihabitans endophyticus TaxID=1751298 RepID=A0A8J3C8C0_9ACTN|nr:hypothetical protein [Mangrovihabitans endophyticus]GGL19402.1 hypothetical protein GCM10012284_62430 [Mangrovihabitans endophyticus]